MEEKDTPAIRKATPADCRELVNLCRKTFYETYKLYNTEEDMINYMDSHFTEPMLAHELLDEHTTVFVVQCGNVLTGYITLRKSANPELFKYRKCIEIARFYVDSDHQNKKLGKLLMEKCFEYVKENRFEILWLGVWQKNIRAVEIYKHIGFQIAGVTTFVLGDDVQEDFIMNLEFKAE